MEKKIISLEVICTDPVALNADEDMPVDMILNFHANRLAMALGSMSNGISGLPTQTQLFAELPQDPHDEEHVRTFISTVSGPGWTTKVIPGENDVIVDYTQNGVDGER